MFKEKRNKGFISGLILSLVFFAFSAGTVFMWNHHQHPMDPFSDDTRSGKEVTMTVYDIYPEVVGEVEGGSVVYLVQYSKDGDGKYAVIEASENDATIKSIMDQATAGTLYDHPATIIGTQLQPLATKKNKSRNNRIVDLSGFLKSILEPSSVVYQNMNSNLYLSTTEHANDGWIFIIGVIFFGGTGVFLVVSAFLIRKKTIASLEEIYQAYPELQGNVENMAGLAEFYDENLKVILYKNHLITYYKGTQALDLRDVDHLYLVETKINKSLFSKKIYQFCYIRKNGKKKQDMVLKSTKTVREQLEELWDLISDKFPDIHIGI
ncbi:hypothetical protein HMPREF2619_04345 [Streptococcus sp. HMSC074B11]|uniref:hypothetical protein n=1 Tax=Streptococcus sp. HMSC074B11 TaxID=1715098 RepID=UPI0008A5DC91|nr:hypothetical protein [Streptococcus sp. HMSC074B11]OFN98002.1 hypothetical protein HMPREF2619_04345 [Streptococcus sp. HMSC074B11]